MTSAHNTLATRLSDDKAGAPALRSPARETRSSPGHHDGQQLTSPVLHGWHLRGAAVPLREGRVPLMSPFSAIYPCTPTVFTAGPDGLKGPSARENDVLNAPPSGRQVLGHRHPEQDGISGSSEGRTLSRGQISIHRGHGHLVARWSGQHVALQTGRVPGCPSPHMSSN